MCGPKGLKGLSFTIRRVCESSVQTSTCLQFIVLQPSTKQPWNMPMCGMCPHTLNISVSQLLTCTIKSHSHLSKYVLMAAGSRGRSPDTKATFSLSTGRTSDALMPSVLNDPAERRRQKNSGSGEPSALIPLSDQHSCKTHAQSSS